MRVIGIDPGLNGALACVWNGQLMHVEDMPVEEKSGGTVKRRVSGALLAELLRRWMDDATLVCIEDVSAMPGQGVASVFSFGDTAGCIRGVCQALALPIQLVVASKWKRDMGLSSTSKEPAQARKDRARTLATQMFPSHAGLWSARAHADRAEAVLLAKWAFSKNF